MRRLTILVAVLALLYSGYWFIGATAAERGAKTALENLKIDGWSVSYDDVSTRGFPSRFDTTFDGLDLQAPDGNFGFAAPFVQAFALSYQPNKVIAAFPTEQVLRLGGQDIAVTTDGLRASAAVGANTALSLDTVTAEVGAATLASDAGWVIALDRALLALREDGPAAFTYDAYLDADGLVLPTALRDIFDPAGIHPDGLAKITLDTTFVLDRALDRHSMAQFEIDPPRVDAFNINRLTLNWGEMSLTGDGALTIRSDGRPEGAITLRAFEWREMLRLIGNAGLIQPGLLPMAEGMGNSLSGGAAELELTISFRDGNMLLGPLPLGPAPRLY